MVIPSQCHALSHNTMDNVQRQITLLKMNLNEKNKYTSFFYSTIAGTQSKNLVNKGVVAKQKCIDHMKK